MSAGITLGGHRDDPDVRGWQLWVQALEHAPAAVPVPGAVGGSPAEGPQPLQRLHHEDRCVLLGPPDDHPAGVGEGHGVLLDPVAEQHAALVHLRDDGERPVEPAVADPGAGGPAGPGLADEEHHLGLGGRGQVERGRRGLRDRQRPAGAPGAAGDDDPGRGLALLAGADRDPVPGRLVRAVPEVDFVEGAQALAVVGAGLDHGAPLDPGASAGRAGEQVGGRLGRVAGEDPVDRLGIGVHPDHRLPPQVLRDVGHEPVGADGHHQVLGLEQEPIEIPSPDPRVPPAGRDCPADPWLPRRPGGGGRGAAGGCPGQAPGASTRPGGGSRGSLLGPRTRSAA